jgi:hypothetical protein
MTIFEGLDTEQKREKAEEIAQYLLNRKQKAQEKAKREYAEGKYDKVFEQLRIKKAQANVCI